MEATRSRFVFNLLLGGISSWNNPPLNAKEKEKKRKEKKINKP